MTDKRILKLKNYSIKKKELEALLNKLGFINRGGKGSHHTWIKKGCLPILIASHGKDLKKYEIDKAIVSLVEAELIKKED